MPAKKKRKVFRPISVGDITDIQMLIGEVRALRTELVVPLKEAIASIKTIRQLYEDVRSEQTAQHAELATHRGQIAAVGEQLHEHRHRLTALEERTKGTTP